MRLLCARTQNGDVCEKISGNESCLFRFSPVTLVKASENQPNGFVECSSKSEPRLLQKGKTYNKLFECSIKKITQTAVINIVFQRIFCIT